MDDDALDDLDIATGMVLGSLPKASQEKWPWTDQVSTPIAALEAAVLSALVRPPCIVSFSGGRDSSALLAVASHLAKKEGLDPPVPATIRFTAEESAEAEWQEAVIAHLSISDWVKVEVSTELELLGPAGTRFLLRHGLRYPQNTHFHDPLMRLAKGGALVSGAGGDELLESHRWSRAALVTGGSVPWRPVDTLRVAAAYSPGPLRSRLYHRGDNIAPDWLLPTGRRLLNRRLHRWFQDDRVRFDEHLEWWRRSRYVVQGRKSLELLASDYQAHFSAPFANDQVMSAFALDRGRSGFPNRTEGMRHLFGGLLPEAIIERSSKATFRNPLVGPVTRSFAATTNSYGTIPDELVNHAALTGAWRRRDVDVRSLPALQLCYLKSQSGGVEPSKASGTH